MKFGFSIIIPNYNGKNFLRECLDSIQKQKYQSIEIIIVDNCSTDSSLKLPANFQNLKILKNTKNVGFGQAINQAAKVAKYPYLMALNNDVVLESNWINKISQTIKKNPNFFAYCGLILKPDKTVENTGFNFYYFGRATLRQQIKSAAIWGTPATAVVYSKEKFQQLNGFSPSYFAFVEDVDLHFRANKLKFQTYFTNKVTAIHYGGGTAGKDTIFRAWHSFKGWLIFVKQNYSFKEIIQNFPQILTERLRNISYLLRCLMKVK